MASSAAAGLGRSRAAGVEWAVHVAAVVWQHVAAAHLLPLARLAAARALPPQLPTSSDGVDRGTCARGRERERLEACSALVRVGEGVWPLAGLACRAALRLASQPWGVGASVGHSGWYHVLVAAASATGDPRSRCVSWIVRNIDSRETMGPTKSRQHKESLAVMFGLCIGGHLPAAKAFFESGTGQEETNTEEVGILMGTRPPGRLTWDKRPGIGLMEDAEAGNFGEFHLLCDICESGYLEMLQWVTVSFGIKEPWQMVVPFAVALRNDHLEVAKWITDTFNLVSNILPSTGTTNWPIVVELTTHCAEGKNPNLVKWFLENFPCESEPASARNLLRDVLWNEHSTLELCKWLQKQLHVPNYRYIPISGIKNPEIRNWAIESFSVLLTEATLNTFCGYFFSSDLSFAEWLISARHIRPTADTLHAACSNPADNPALVKWLSMKVDLSPAEFIQSLLSSLRMGNIRIANWLEETYSVMNIINSQGSSGVSKALLEICKHTERGIQEKLEGIEWFVGRLNAAVELDNDTALEVLDQAAASLRPKAILFIIKAFHIGPVIPGSSIKKGGILQCVAQRTLNEVKELTSLISFSAEDVSHCLSMEGACLCSDTIRWLVENFNLAPGHIKANTNFLLFRLLMENKKGCAEWLIDSFKISLKEVLTIFARYGRQTTITGNKELHISTWRMLLNKFPQLECDSVWGMVPAVANVWCIARYTQNKYGGDRPAARELNKLAQLGMEYIPGRWSLEFQLWAMCWIANRDAENSIQNTNTIAQRSKFL
ncbi:hypothetical protein Pelo_3037 [Pelomyxa schiedti]|nr:hypothetical protein Pelo_3037 [Pelomyxa schiedti]